MQCMWSKLKLKLDRGRDQRKRTKETVLHLFPSDDEKPLILGYSYYTYVDNFLLLLGYLFRNLHFFFIQMYFSVLFSSNSFLYFISFICTIYQYWFSFSQMKTTTMSVCRNLLCKRPLKIWKMRPRGKLKKGRTSLIQGLNLWLLMVSMKVGTACCVPCMPMCAPLLLAGGCQPTKYFPLHLSPTFYIQCNSCK